MAWPHTPTGSSRRRSSQMPTGKRANMREGPLADLFRKTAEDTGAAPAKPGAPDSKADREQKTADTERTAQPTEPERRSHPHPSLQASDTHAEPEVQERHIPTPQERL